MRLYSREISPFFLILIAVLTLGSFAGSARASANDIPLEQILDSRATQLFKTQEYDQALVEFQKLSQEHPNDLLPRRYMAMTLILLGRLDEAIAILQDNVAKEPNNPAHHYYLARAYHEQGAQAKAKAELEEVLRLDPKGFYGDPARKALPLVTEKALTPKRWDIWLGAAYEYDTNVPISPSEKDLRGINDGIDDEHDVDDLNANRYSIRGGGKYQWFQKGRWDSTIGYQFYKSLHDDGLSDFNYTYNEFFGFTQYHRNIFSREVTTGLRYALPFSFLGGKTYLFAVELTAYANGRLTKNTYTEIYHRYSHIEFGPDGEQPNLTSRDGNYDVTGVHHRFYFSELKRYVFIGYEFQTAAVRGNNFDRLGHFFQAGLHTPVVGKLDLDVVGGFTYANYPHYSAELDPEEPLARRDNDWTLLAALTYRLTSHLSLRGFYRYFNANNRNDIYQYNRDIGGVEALFRY